MALPALYGAAVLSRVVRSVRAMFCPECKAEYRLGFTRCADGDVGLVEELPREGPEDLRRVWAGDSQADCVDACLELQDAGIPYKAAQAAEGLTLGKGVALKFEIRVPYRDYDRARAALGITEPGPESADQAYWNYPPVKSQRSSESPLTTLG